VSVYTEEVIGRLPRPKYTEAQIDSNRRKYVAALKRTKRQCRRSMFDDKVPCAIGLAVRLFFGVRSEEEYNALLDRPGFVDFYTMAGDALGIPFQAFPDAHGNGPLTVRDIYQWNDSDELSFKEIAAKLTKAWGL